jgi:cobalt-zinc-cadmium resistance protein CzcA
MVDGSVVVVENAFAQLGEAANGESKARIILRAVVEVATPVIFGVGIIILVFLPLMTLEGMEGKMFAPLAYTIAIALAISLVLSLTLTPVLSTYLLKAPAHGGDHDTRLIAWHQGALSADARLGAGNERKTVGIALAGASRWPVPVPGHGLHSRNEGRLDGAGYQPRAQHLAR